MTRHSGPMGTAPQTTQVLDTPEHVPGYRDLARIGHGGFSVVYRAVQESFERDVALKLLTIVGPDEDARRRFVREVRLAGRLSDHPHVVTVLDTGTTASGRPYLAMDLYDGGSMKQWLTRRGPLTGAQAAGVGAKIADALHAAHALGVLHRDVKPNNILVSRYGEPALADFGVSWLLDASNSSSVLDVFSPQHAAPELMTRGVPTASSDVYALGSTLYELIAGRPPFGGAGQDVRRTIYLALSEPAPLLDCPDLPGLAEVIDRAMAKEPADRFPDAAGFGRALRALIPDGVSTALVMADPLAATAGLALEAPDSPGFADPSRSVDMTDAMDLYSGQDEYVSRPDDTMVRPDRVDEDAVVPGPRGGGGRRRPDDRRGSDDRRGPDSGRAGDSGRGGRRGGYGERTAAASGARDRRGLGKPLALVAVVILLAVGAWALVPSKDSSSSGSKNAAGPGQSPTATSPGAATSGSAAAQSSTSGTSSSRSSSSSSPSSTRHSTSAEPTHTVTTTASTGASVPVVPPPTASSTGPLLPSDYHRFQNSATGSCLAGSAGLQACADSKTQGWQSKAPGILGLGAVTGQEELVNGDSGNCLSGGSGGGVSVKACSGDLSQVWSKTGGSGGGTELQNSADMLCLKASGGSVVEAMCNGDASELWSEDGNV